MTLAYRDVTAPSFLSLSDQNLASRWRFQVCFVCVSPPARTDVISRREDICKTEAHIHCETLSSFSKHSKPCLETNLQTICAHATPPQRQNTQVCKFDLMVNPWVHNDHPTTSKLRYLCVPQCHTMDGCADFSDAISRDHAQHAIFIMLNLLSTGTSSFVSQTQLHIMRTATSDCTCGYPMGC